MNKEELNEKDIKKIKQEVTETLPRCIEFLQKEPFVDAVNDVFWILPSKAVESYPLWDNFYLSLYDSVLEWLFSTIQSETVSPEEKEKRIDQSVFVCFMIYEFDKVTFYRSFKKYVAPFIVESGSTKEQMIEAIQRKIHSVAHNKEYRNVRSLLLKYMRCLVLKLDGRKVKVIMDESLDEYDCEETEEEE